MKEDNLSQVLAVLSSLVPDWSGGTKIGTSLHTFLEHYGTGMVDRNTVVLIMSDGWDTGDIETLEHSMDEIQRRARCLVWLNPLMGSPEYQPTCRGMQAALPFIDIFAPAHNLESLRQLVRHLGAIQRGTARLKMDPFRRFDESAPAAPAPAPKLEEKVDRQAWLNRFGITT